MCSPAVPRPNVLLYMSPVHVNVHQESCLWLVEFMHGVVKTVNIQLALAVKDEGKSFLVSGVEACLIKVSCDIM